MSVLSLQSALHEASGIKVGGKIPFDPKIYLLFYSGKEIIMAKTRVKNNLHVRKKSRKGRMKVEKLLLQEIPELEKTMEQGYLSMEKAIPHEQPVIDDVARTDGMFTEQISEQKITNIKEFSEEASMERTKKWELSDIKRTE